MTATAAVRRRSRSAEPTQTVSYTFHRSTVEALRELGAAGQVDNASAFVEEAVRARLRELWWEQRESEYVQAAADPSFTKGLEELEKDFSHADAEALRKLGEG